MLVVCCILILLGVYYFEQIWTLFLCPLLLLVYWGLGEPDWEYTRLSKRYFRTKDLSLSCPNCGKLAPPIEDTTDRYRCEECGHQFAGAPHNFR
jgi:hypothetical protein